METHNVKKLVNRKEVMEKIYEIGEVYVDKNKELSAVGVGKYTSILCV